MRREIEGLERLQNAHRDEQYALRGERNTANYYIDSASKSIVKLDKAIELRGEPVYGDAFKVGPQLTTESFVKTLEGMTFNRDMFGTAELTFGPDKHQGNRYSRLSQIQEGRWKVTSDYVAFSGLKPVMQKDGKWKVESEFFKDQ